MESEKSSGVKVVIFLQEREVIESKLSQCIQLNTDYREAYQKIKNKKVPLCGSTYMKV